MSTAEPMVADLRAESDDLDAIVADLPADRWADPTPASGVDDRPSDRAPAVDRSCRADRRHRRGRLRGGARRGRQGSDGFRRRRSRGVGRAAAGTSAGRLARDPGSSARRTAGRRRRPQAAVVRSADERRLDGHRAADGDLGPRSGRRRHARGEATRDGSAAFDRAHRRAHPRLRVLHQRARLPRRSRSAWSCVRPTARSGAATVVRARAAPSVATAARLLNLAMQPSSSFFWRHQAVARVLRNRVFRRAC